MTDRCCKNCDFAVPAMENGTPSDKDGFCYFWPPALVEINTSAYPPILLSRWCGQFAPRPPTASGQKPNQMRKP